MNHLTNDNLTETSLFRQLTNVLAAVVVVGSAFHFWPWSQNSLWKIFCPANFALLIWICVSFYCFVMARKSGFVIPIPHISVAALVIVHWLSLAYSPDLTRSIIYNLKLMVVYFAGFSLLRLVINRGMRQKIYYLSILAVFMSGYARKKQRHARTWYP